MKIGIPEPHRTGFEQTEPKIRWVNRNQEIRGMGADVTEAVLVLQEMRFDGHNALFWSDVQIEDET